MPAVMSSSPRDPEEYLSGMENECMNKFDEFDSDGLGVPCLLSNDSWDWLQPHHDPKLD